jgi:hypothetical protein
MVTGNLFDRTESKGQICFGLNYLAHPKKTITICRDKIIFFLAKSRKISVVPRKIAFSAIGNFDAC